MTVTENPNTVPTLWNVTRDFFLSHPEYVARDNHLNFLVDHEAGLAGDYNLCHFWSNFEIASLNFFRSEGYTKYFEHLDKAQGFFLERWGDAPVHTLGL